MKLLKYHPIGSILSGILIVLILVLSISGGIVASSCSSEKTDTTEVMKIKPPDNPAANILIVDPVTITKLYNLELSNTDYNTLKRSAGTGNNANRFLVFQFLYDETKTYHMTLIAYAARFKHHFQTKKDDSDPDEQSHPLTYKELTAKSVAGLTLGEKFALGDQQVSIDSITKLLSNANNPVNYTLTFTPEKVGFNIRFAIDVYQGMKKLNRDPTYTNPSPPANAE